MSIVAASSSPALVARPSLSVLRNQMGSGLLGALSTEELRELLNHAELVGLKAGTNVVEQYHPGEHFFLLMEGQVEFLLVLESAGETFSVGVESQAWTPVGWSVFRAPNRYATTVRTRCYSEFLRFKVPALEALFEQRPSLAYSFFEAVCRDAESLLEGARERLFEQTEDLEPGSEDSSPSDLARAEALETKVSDLNVPAPIASVESMVTNAAPDVLELFARAEFFEPLSEEHLAALAATAKVEYFHRGERIRRGRAGATDLLVLAEGRIRHEYEGSCGRRLILPNASIPGEVITWPRTGSTESGMVRLRATRDGSLLRLSRAALTKRFLAQPEMGAAFQRRVLWLLGRRLRSTRSHLVSRSHQREIVAVHNLLEQVRTELRVSSPLHKIPHLISSALTMADALKILDDSLHALDPLERHTGKLCLALVEPLRREARFFSGLQSTFEEIAGSSPASTPHELRVRSAACFARVFAEIPSRIEGLQHLPKESGCIFIFNHLRNHEHNTLPNGFQLTLDSHFISSMILQPAYGDPGVRVVRESRAEEYGHHSYYRRLGHISVYTPESDYVSTPGNDRFDKFCAAAAEHLAAGRNLVIAPEGISRPTEESPGRFKAGAFRLASSLRPEPWIVPIAVAHFDRRLGNNTLIAVVHAPFKVSQRVKDPNDSQAMSDFLEAFRSEFGLWVKEAVRLKESPAR